MFINIADVLAVIYKKQKSAEKYLNRTQLSVIRGRKGKMTSYVKRVLFLLFLLAIIFLIGCQQTTSPTGKLVGKNCKQVQEAYTEQVPYEVIKDGSKVLFNEELNTVPANKRLALSVNIDIADKQSNSISGLVEETAGYDINFLVFDQKNYNAWQAGQPYTPYVIMEKTKASRFSFVPDHADIYVFVLDNGYSVFTNKVPRISATWDYKYKDIEYREETRYRTVESCE